MKPISETDYAMAVKNRLKCVLITFAITAIATIYTMLTACGVPEKDTGVPAAYTPNPPSAVTAAIEPADVVIVVTCARGQAFRVPDSVLAFSSAAIEAERYTGAVLADGRPNLEGLHYTARKTSESGRAKEVAASQRDFTDFVCSMRAIDEGVDLLGGISAAAGALHSYGSGSGVICVVSSGLTDYPSTNADLLGANAPAIVAQLAANESIPDLMGIEVRFYGLGQSSGSQVIPDSASASLKTLWASIVEAGGGEAVICNDYLTELGCDDLLPATTTFSFPEDTITVPAECMVREEIVLTDAVLTFVGDKAIFSDEPQAHKVLGAIATQAARDGVVITIDGYTADSPARTEEFLMDLSLRRAEAVASALEGLGVPHGAIVSVSGHGSEGSTSMATGSFDESQAELDRRVVVTIFTQTIV